MRRDQSHSGVASRRAVFAVLVVVTGGLLLTSIVFWRVRAAELGLFRARLASDSAARATLIKYRLDECLLVTTALHQFLTVAEPVGRREFSAFTAAFSAAASGLKAIEWVPAVPRGERLRFEEEGRLALGPGFRLNERDANGRSVAAGERDRYYPVFYVEPLGGNEPAVGFDLGSNPVRLAALERARDSGQPAATQRIKLVQERGEAYGFLVFVPVYGKGPEPATVEQRRSSLRGFALAVFDSDLLMRSLLHPRDAIGLDFDLLDLSAPQDERLLDRWVSPLRGKGPWEPWYLPRPPTVGYDFSFAGREWGLEFTPNQAYLERDYPLAYWFLLPVGFLITIVSALYIHAVLSHSRRLEDEVQARTAKLSESERRLSDILSNVQDAYFRADLAGRLVMVSPSAPRMYGYGSPEEMVGLAARNLYADPAERTSIVEDLRSRGRVHDRIGRGLRRDGSTFFVSLNAQFYLDEHGAVAGTEGFVRDITERQRAEEARRESELRYRTLFESASDAIFLMKDGRFVECNPRTLEVFGCSRDQILGHAPAEFSPETQRDGSPSAPASQARVRAALAGEPQSFEWLHCRRDRTVFEAEVSLKRIELGGEAYLQAIVRDVTAHKRADAVQAAIYEISEATQKAVTLDDLFAAVHRIVGRLMEARNFYIALYDASTDLLSFPYFVDEMDERPAPFRVGKGITSQVVRSGEPLLATTEDLREMEARGQISPLGADSVDWLGVPLKVEGRVIGVLAVQSYTGKVRYSEADKGVLSHVSDQVAQAIERKRAEDELRRSEARFRSYFEMPLVGIAMSSPEKRWIQVNDRLCSILGYSRDELLGIAWSEITDPDDLESNVRLFDRLLAGEIDQYALEKRFIRKDGTAIWTSLAAGCVRKPDRGVDYLVVLVEDISERKAAEEALERSRAQLLQSQKMEVVGTLAGGVAHDFNNLLQAALSLTQLLQAHAHEPERVKALGLELAHQINHGASLTRQLLLFSRRETTRPEPLDLNDVVRDAARMLRRLVRANISLEIELADEALPVTADRGQVEQVLMNLAVNASDAMPEGGRCTIRTGALGAGHVWLTMEDTGVGIPEAIRQRIFEPFFSTKGVGQGTGLGLSVAHGIVTHHGGSIEVGSEVGRGTRFRVILPRAGSAGSAAVDESPKATAGLPEGNGERVLVVEDEAAAREGLREILRSLGYEVVAAGSGEEAAALPPEQPFDLLLTDLMLPGISGPRLAASLRQRWPSLRVVLMSGYPEDEAVRKGIAEGSIRFLQKPFDMARLAHEIKEALAEAREPEKRA